MASYLLLTIAIVCLALSMAKHFKDSFSRPISEQQDKVLTCAGWGLLLASLCVLPWQGIHFVYWFCYLSVLILVVAYSLTKLKAMQRKRK